MSHNYFYRMKIQYSSFGGERHLPCKSCGMDSIDAGRVPLHFIVVGAMFVLFNIFDSKLEVLYRIFNIDTFPGISLIFPISVMFFYFMFFPPLRKK